MSDIKSIPGAVTQWRPESGNLLPTNAPTGDLPMLSEVRSLKARPPEARYSPARIHASFSETCLIPFICGNFLPAASIAGSGAMNVL